MILGTGVDIVAIERIERSWSRFHERFAQRILHPKEMHDFRCNRDPARFLAKRFAVKEAFSKALGTGFRHGLSFTHIAVTHDALGKPELHYEQVAETMAQRLKVQRAHMSLSDEQTHVVAFVILEG